MKNIIIFSALIIAIINTSCKKNTVTPIPRDGKKIKIGLALGSKGLGDRSFNDIQHKGLISALKTHNVTIVYKTSKKDTYGSYKKALIELADKERCDLVFVGEGYGMAPVVNKIAPNYKKTHFVVMDFIAKKLKNVSSTTFAQYEGAYLAGVLAALMTKTKKIALIGGVNIPVVKEFEYGFLGGVKYINKKIETKITYITKKPNMKGFNMPQKAKTIADSLYKSGYDIIFSVAGKSGISIIESAQENKKYVIGVDTDQDYIAPGFVLTSVMKRMDNVIVDIAGRYMKSELKGKKTYHYKIKNGGISLSPMTFTKDKIPSSVHDKIVKVMTKIIDGDIIVFDPTYGNKK